jgi:hypothetical protein
METMSLCMDCHYHEKYEPVYGRTDLRMLLAISEEGQRELDIIGHGVQGVTPLHDCVNLVRRIPGYRAQPCQVHRRVIEREGVLVRLYGDDRLLWIPQSEVEVHQVVVLQRCQYGSG